MDVLPFLIPLYPQMFSKNLCLAVPWPAEAALGAAAGRKRVSTLWLVDGNPSAKSALWCVQTRPECGQGKTGFVCVLSKGIPALFLNRLLSDSASSDETDKALPLPCQFHQTTEKEEVKESFHHEMTGLTSSPLHCGRSKNVQKPGWPVGKNWVKGQNLPCGTYLSAGDTENSGMLTCSCKPAFFTFSSVKFDFFLKKKIELCSCLLYMHNSS